MQVVFISGGKFNGIFVFFVFFWVIKDQVFVIWCRHRHWVFYNGEFFGKIPSYGRFELWF